MGGVPPTEEGVSMGFDDKEVAVTLTVAEWKHLGAAIVNGVAALRARGYETWADQAQAAHTAVSDQVVAEFAIEAGREVLDR